MSLIQGSKLCDKSTCKDVNICNTNTFACICFTNHVNHLSHAAARVCGYVCKDQTARAAASAVCQTDDLICCDALARPSACLRQTQR